MDIRDLVKRLEDIETEARDKREYGLEDSIGRLIEDLIEEDLETERQFRKEVSKYIDEKIERVSSINEDDNLKELVDKKKMKDMQREIKLLEKRKAKMEKIYEKSSGKKYQKQEMVDENE